MSETERRRAELRQGPGRTVEGVAVRYGDLAQLPWGQERVEAGAFAPIGDVILNASHDRTAPLARTGGCGLRFDDNAERLALTADLPVTRAADDVLTLVRTGVLRGLSVEFRAVAERFEAGVRVIERATLAGVAVVDTPAYPASEIEARRRRGERRTWIRGGVKYGVKAHCQCAGDGCEVMFRPEALEVMDTTLALTGRASEAVASMRGGTLRVKNTPERLTFEIDDAARDTAAGRQLGDLATARVPVYARPIIDEATAEFEVVDGVRQYTRAPVRALLLKPIVGPPEQAVNWEQVVIAPAAKRRHRVWL